TSNPAGTYENAATEDRHGTLAEKHVVALGHDNAAQRGMVGAWRQVTAGTTEGGRRHSLALAAIGASPHGTVHPLKCHQPTASVAHGYVHLCADLRCLRDCTCNHPVRICKRQSHASYSPFNGKRSTPRRITAGLISVNLQHRGVFSPVLSI